MVFADVLANVPRPVGAFAALWTLEALEIRVNFTVTFELGRGVTLEWTQGTLEHLSLRKRE